MVYTMGQSTVKVGTRYSIAKVLQHNVDNLEFFFYTFFVETERS